MKTHLLALLSLFCIGTASAQTPRDERIARAVERMDDGDYDEATKKQVRYLMDHDRKELIEIFYYFFF